MICKMESKFNYQNFNENSIFSFSKDEWLTARKLEIRRDLINFVCFVVFMRMQESNYA